MKYYLLVLAFIFSQITASAGNNFLFAKEDSATNSLVKSTTNNSKKNNVLKINLSSLAMRNFALQYERKLLPNFSVGIGYRIMPNGQIPHLSSVQQVLNDYADLGDNRNTVFGVLDDAKVKGRALTLDARLYFSKQMKGVYIAGFLRSENYDLKSTFPFQIDGARNTATIYSSFSNIGAGLMLGVQFHLTKRLNLDCWLVGPYLGASKITVIAKDYYIEEADLAEFEQQFNELKIANKYFKATAQVGQNMASADITGSMPGVRALGFNLGWRF